ncbi:glutathione-dependent disulfide-bond oxidoreductase [Moritella viscosa]|uniref:Glutathione S-transferase n=1 Tax=Moritella viscosa TaxID=80854 RepID=A0ABY1HJI4_9GAMM|nr:glutathione-dependent disulfide-bond oxidoreductase [Moritella viscosa]SGZ01671.1 Putative glutathione S-transferase [Moritella viscosa]SGZ16414.1 Putative glutathione S-transferase [Moritella viscosa]SHO28595.1 Putative glutathione S-transferase [Moritella viscosa]
MESEYIPPAVWTNDDDNGGAWASINRPVSGATHDKVLPVGSHPLQLYSLGTPNGQKVTIMLEELLALGVIEAEYDAHIINIGEGDQFSSGFVGINPNSKIPALVDQSGELSIEVFESGAILLYLADKFGHLLPKDIVKRTTVLNWLFWLQGAAPYLGGGFGHFYAYAPAKFEYPINRFTMEVKRQLDLLDKQLAANKFIAGDEYSIADIAIWSWYGNVVLGKAYDAAEFLDVASYKYLRSWAQNIADRPAVQRGRIVNRTSGEAWEALSERHSAADITEALKLKP